MKEIIAPMIFGRVETFKHGGAIPRMNQADKYMLSKNLSSKGRIYGKNKGF
jgi:hypothetical protein